MCVRWGRVYSSSFIVTNGVRQGGILSPYLFNVYVNDLSVKLNSCHVGCYYSGEFFGLSHDVLFNNKKSTIMSFRAGNLKDAQLPLYTLKGEVLCDSASDKYLGHFICSDLSDDTDILRQRRCLTIQGIILLRKFHMCSIEVFHVTSHGHVHA